MNNIRLFVTQSCHFCGRYVFPIIRIIFLPYWIPDVDQGLSKFERPSLDIPSGTNDNSWFRKSAILNHSALCVSDIGREIMKFWQIWNNSWFVLLIPIYIVMTGKPIKEISQPWWTKKKSVHLSRYNTFHGNFIHRISI